MRGYTLSVAFRRAVPGARAAGLAPCVGELPFWLVERRANWVSLILAQRCGQTVPTQLSALTRPRGIYLRTHSAGAHLAAVMLLPNWTERGVTPNFRGSHRDRSRAGQPPPSPTGPEAPRWSLVARAPDSGQRIEWSWGL